MHYLKILSLPLILLVFFNPGMHAQKEVNQELENHKRSFDFWIGEWDVYKYNTDTLVGRSSITRILNGNAVKEEYLATQSKYEGTSLNKYNRGKGIWEQFWVDNSGLTLHIEGGMVDNKMVMKNVMNFGKGDIENRISWYRDTPDTVRQTWDQKKPEDENWTTIFDGSYREHVENK